MGSYISKPLHEHINVHGKLSNARKLNSSPPLVENDTVVPHVVNERKYQTISKKYILPHDDKEKDRLTQVHFLYKHLFDSNFSAPVKDLLSIKKQSRRSSTNSQYNWLQEPDPPRVLDIACGNGTWILEMASEFPDSQFYGIDIVAGYPTTIKPPNASFSQADILNQRGLPYPNEYFDYIHMRQVYPCFSENDWEVVVKEIKRLLKPGGYIEVRDVDPLLKNVSDSTAKLLKEYPSVMKEKLGINIFWASSMFELFKRVEEMSEMHQVIKQLEFNTTGPIGKLVETSFRAALDSYKLFFVNYMSIPDDKYENIADTVTNNAIKDCSYFNYYCCWGRKSLLLNTILHQHIDSTVPPSQRKYSVVNATNSSTNKTSPLARNHSFHTSSYDLAKEIQTKKTYNNNMDCSQQKLEIAVHPLEEQVGSLAVESVFDIDQFSAGYED